MYVHSCSFNFIIWLNKKDTTKKGCYFTGAIDPKVLVKYFQELINLISTFQWKENSSAGRSILQLTSVTHSKLIRREVI